MAKTTIPIPADPAETPLVYLRAIRGMLDDHSRKFDEVITRLGALERGQADLRRDVAEVHVGLAGVNTRLDNIDRRVTRIERRLDLIEDPTPTGAR